MRGFCSQETKFPVVYVIVDDASTDGTPAVIKRYVEKHFDLDNKGVTREEETSDYQLIFAQHKSNLNCFFAVVLLKYNHYQLHKPKKPYISEWSEHAEYRAICEGDDYWTDPHKLEKQVSILKNDPVVGLVHSNCDFIDQETGNYISEANSSLGDVYFLSDQTAIINAILAGKYRIRTPSVVYRASVADKAFSEQDKFLYNGYFKMGDIQFWIGIIRLSKVVYIPNSMVVYRICPGSVSRPRNYYDTILFNLSSKELRIYYNQKYGYGSDIIDTIMQEYKQLLKTYREHDASYKGIVEIDKLFDNKWQYLVFKIRNQYDHFRFQMLNLLKKV